jgi:hypothetical protein
VIFTGYLFGEGYRELLSNAHAFVETSMVSGRTRRCSKPWRGVGPGFRVGAPDGGEPACAYTLDRGTRYTAQIMVNR